MNYKDLWTSHSHRINADDSEKYMDEEDFKIAILEWESAKTVSRVELPVMPNEVVDGGLTEEEQEFMEMIINWQMENPKAYERIKSFADVAISRATLFSALADYASQREA